jgi:hypothetical protein
MQDKRAPTAPLFEENTIHASIDSSSLLCMSQKPHPQSRRCPHERCGAGRACAAISRDYAIFELDLVPENEIISATSGNYLFAITTCVFEACRNKQVGFRLAIGKLRLRNAFKSTQSCTLNTGRGCRQASCRSPVSIVEDIGRALHHGGGLHSNHDFIGNCSTTPELTTIRRHKQT